MSQKVIYILVMISIYLINVRGQYYSEPDLENARIPLQWRQLCGFRYFPKNITFPQKCFKNLLGYRLLSNPVTSFRKPGKPSGRIINGRSVKSRESPWTVQIAEKFLDANGRVISDEWLCTGVLLTMRHILTAAHCQKPEANTRVYVGSDRFMFGWFTDAIRTFTKHHNFEIRMPDGSVTQDPNNDIGMITLRTPIDWQRRGKRNNSEQLFINTICLPKEEAFIQNGLIVDPFSGNPYTNAALFGFGIIRAQELPRTLQRGDVLVKYNDILDPTLFETKADASETRACNGDSGGGLVQYLDKEETRAVLIGIDSHFINKLRIASPPCDVRHVGKALATRVTRHLDWINNQIRP